MSCSKHSFALSPMWTAGVVHRTRGAMVLTTVGLSRLPTLSQYLIPLLSILNTVPGIVFIGMLVILIEGGKNQRQMVPNHGNTHFPAPPFRRPWGTTRFWRRSTSVIIALSIYAMFPVLKNTVTGLNGVDQQYKEAARGG